MTPSPSSETVVLITGGNQGLGYECVKKLAAEQPDYRILIGSRDLAKGQDAAADVAKLAARTTTEAVQLDVTSDDSISAAVSLVQNKYGRIDVLFNNAGIMFVNEPSPRAEFRKVLETNTISPVCVTEAFLPLLREAATPRILFMSSGMGSMTLTTLPFSPFYSFDFKAYSVSKAGLNMVGLMYAKQLKESGFKVNVIDPGFRQTNLNGFHSAGGGAAEGAIEACRVIADSSKDGPTATFTAVEGQIPW